MSASTADLLKILVNISNLNNNGSEYTDLSGVFLDPSFSRDFVAAVKQTFTGKVDRVLGLESMGFLLAGMVSHAMDLPLVIARKNDKVLPGWFSADSQNVYRKARLGIPPDGVRSGDRILVVDDILTTGSTATAALEMVEASGGTVGGVAHLIVLPFVSEAMPPEMRPRVWTYPMYNHFSISATEFIGLRRKLFPAPPIEGVVADLPYKMAAIDIDGTFELPDGSVSAANQAMLHQATEAGLKLVFCTSRLRHEVPWLVFFPEHIKESILTTGSMLWDCAADRSLKVHAIDPELVYEVRAQIALERNPLLLLADCSSVGYDVTVVSDDTFWARLDDWFSYLRIRERWCGLVLRHATTMPDDLRDIVRLDIAGSRDELSALAPKLRQALGERLLVEEPDPINIPQDRWVLRLLPPGINKLSGVQWICDRYGFDMSQVIAIGDSAADISMLRAAGCSVAMGNAEESLFEVARHKTLPLQEDGVAHALRQILTGKWS